MKWIQSAGGPLLCVGKATARYWNGIQGADNVNEKKHIAQHSDYDKACHIKDYVGIIRINKEQALVLGDMPLNTTVLKNSNGRIAIVRAFYLDSESDIFMIGDAFDYGYDNGGVESIEFNIKEGNMLIFDSALGGKKIGNEFIEFDIQKGNYNIITHIAKPSERVSLLVHLFCRLLDD